MEVFRSLSLHLLDKSSYFFNAADFVEPFELAFNVALPGFLLGVFGSLFPQERLKVLEFILKIGFHVLLLFVDLSDVLLGR